MNWLKRHTLLGTAALICAGQCPSWAEGADEHFGAGVPDNAMQVLELRNRNIGTREYVVDPANRVSVETLDEETLKRSFGVLASDRDGNEQIIPPSEELIRILGDERPENTLVPESGPDPALNDTNRLVHPPDDRVQIINTQAYPFSAIGQLWSRYGSSWFTCSATLVSRDAVVTAAHCLYDHDLGGWADAHEFYPGLNGTYAPFGLYDWSRRAILSGYVKNYEGYYGSVMAWDLGVLRLDRSAGDVTGWIKYQRYDPAHDFVANIVGYPGDMPDSTMWRSSCDVDSSIAEDYNFPYLCDTFSGSSGSAVYDYYPESRDRRILGVNVGSSSSFNWGMRFNNVFHAWVQEQVEE